MSPQHASVPCKRWMAEIHCVPTLGSLYVAALTTFVDIATGEQPEILLKQPLQNPSDPPSDLTKSPAYVGTLKEHLTFVQPWSAVQL